MLEGTVVVHVKAERVEDLGNGVFRLFIPGTTVSEEQQKMLNTLFPNLQEGVYRLLNQETLLASIAKY